MVQGVDYRCHGCVARHVSQTRVMKLYHIWADRNSLCNILETSINMDHSWGKAHKATLCSRSEGTTGTLIGISNSAQHTMNLELAE
jgi:hypothetical protein